MILPAASSETADSTGSSNSQIFVVNLADLKNNLEGDLTAIEFQNNSGDWDSPDENSWAPWSMEIEKIRLEKLASSQIGIDVDNPENSDIVVSQDSSSNPGKIIFTAPDTYESYVWKVNGEIQQDATGNVFIFDKEKLPDGQTNRPAGIYDISLLADQHSWSTQVTIN